jgi:hypothetical protein
MNFKALLLLCLLLFASVGTIALVSGLSIIPKNSKTATSALGPSNVQPCGGDDIDNPHPS